MPHCMITSRNRLKKRFISISRSGQPEGLGAPRVSLRENSKTYLQNLGIGMPPVVFSGSVSHKFGRQPAGGEARVDTGKCDPRDS